MAGAIAGFTPQGDRAALIDQIRPISSRKSR
jgi:hypothetical protein